MSTVCRQCRSEVPIGANYCPECGHPHALDVLDPLGLEDSPAATGAASSSRTAGLLVILAVVVGAGALLWALSRGDDPAEESGDGDSGVDEPGANESPADPDSDVAESTTTTTSSTTTTTIVPGPDHVNDSAEPPLGEPYEVFLVGFGEETMWQVDLTSGLIESFDLQYQVFPYGPYETVVLAGTLVASAGPVHVLTDLATGEQRTLPPVDDLRTDLMFAAGRAGPESIWLAGHQGSDESSVREVTLDGEVLGGFEIPPGFWVLWALDRYVYLGSPDGSFRYEASTGEVTELAGSVISDPSALLVMVSCGADLECHIDVDRGDGPERVEWLGDAVMLDGSVHVAPDQSGLLVHSYADFGIEFWYVDLVNGSTTELGMVPLAPYAGIAWVPDSSWVVGEDDRDRSRWVALNVETGAQVTMPLPMDIGDRPGAAPLVVPW